MCWYQYFISNTASISRVPFKSMNFGCYFSVNVSFLVEPFAVILLLFIYLFSGFIYQVLKAAYSEVKPR